MNRGFSAKLCRRFLASAAPAFNDALRRREHVDPASLPADRSVLIYNQFDPIGVEARDRGGLVGATVCTFAPPEPEACVECYSRRPFGGAACDRCFEQTFPPSSTSCRCT
ncbi:unnamed protein product [Prorocentrum cordatum]|uniref:Laminin EGF-like domain-containing protein n=1 Tax=Prorocentrum cordatum TaxID=2364126 RepID=A0ABN9TLP1_9DINO|nr:unnamed protein product [Polarella glacialis]